MTLSKTIERQFYLKPTLTLAKELLGKILVHRISDITLLVGKIVETEAYTMQGDPACHTAKGKTKRNTVMFLEGGHLYVYQTYGMYYCMNIVTEEKDNGSAVLIRAIEPLEGIEYMQERREKFPPTTSRSKLYNNKKIPLLQLTNGPAKCCIAYNLNLEHNSIDLCISSSTIYLCYSQEAISDNDIIASTRVGITKGVELPWRFYIKENPYVSKK